MNNVERFRVILSTVFSIFALLFIILFVFSSYFRGTTPEASETGRNDRKNTINLDECEDLVFDQLRGRFECEKYKNEPKRSWNTHPVRNNYMTLIFCAWMIALLYIISRRIRASAQQFHEDQTRGQDWRISHPVIAISTVSSDYTNITNNSTPTPQTASSENNPDNSPPPKYQPPPSYSECVANINEDAHHKPPPSMTKIV